MSSIQTGIVLQDNFSNVAQGVVESMYNMTAAAYEASQAVSSNVDTSSIQAATEEINQATAAMDELNAAASRPTTSSVAQPVVDGGNGQVINVDVNPVLPDPLVENPEPLTLDIQPNAPPTGEIGQRIENIRNQLNDVLSMQQQIDQTAATVDVLPDEVTNRMSRVNALIEQIQANLAFSVENPFGLGGNEIEQQLSAIERSLNQAVTQQNMLNNAVGNTGDSINDNIHEQEQFNQEISAGTQQANELTNTIKRAVAAYVSIQSVGKALDISDELASTTARLNLMNDNLQSTEELTNMVYAAAQNSRGAFSDMAANVAKIGNLAGDAFSSSEQIVVFAEQLNKQMKLSGASTQEASAAMLQLTQSLAKGCLNGDELTSVMENGSAVTKTIAEYMGITQGELKDLAAEGQVTSDIIIAAMLGAADQTNAAFETLPMTWADVWQSMKNSALVAFRPVLQRINDLANSQAVQTFVNGAIEAMAVLANIVLNIFELVGTVGGFIADNWSVISPIIYGVIGALAVYAAHLGIVKGIELASAAASAAMAVGKGLYAAATMIATHATWAETTAQLGLNGAMYACPIVWIIMLIIALIAIIFAVCNAIAKMTGVTQSGFGLICGVVNVGVAFIKNLIIGLINTIITLVVNLYNTIANFAAAFSIIFNDPVAAIKATMLSLLNFIVGVVSKAASMLDAVFGSNLADAVSQFQGKIQSEIDATITNAGGTAANTLNPADYTLDRVNYGDAFNAGASFGDGISDKISNFSLSDLFGKTEVPDPASYADGFNDVIANSGIGDGVGSIDDNTGKIKDSLEVSEDELKYLRDIAEQEAINRFTTAEVTINQTNNNNVSSDTDLDGFITALDDAMGEAIESITEGAK